MNSIVIVNWEDKDFAERVLYSLEKQGFKRTEDYESAGAHLQVWEKEGKNNARGRTLGVDPLAPIKFLPVDLMVAKITGRLAGAYMPEGTPAWQIEHMATNLIYDLMGKPG